MKIWISKSLGCGKKSWKGNPIPETTVFVTLSLGQSPSWLANASVPWHNWSDPGKVSCREGSWDPLLIDFINFRTLEHYLWADKGRSSEPGAVKSWWEREVPEASVPTCHDTCSRDLSYTLKLSQPKQAKFNFCLVETVQIAGIKLIKWRRSKWHYLLLI